MSDEKKKVIVRRLVKVDSIQPLLLEYVKYRKEAQVGKITIDNMKATYNTFVPNHDSQFSLYKNVLLASILLMHLEVKGRL